MHAPVHPTHVLRFSALFLLLFLASCSKEEAKPDASIDPNPNPPAAYSKLVRMINDGGAGEFILEINNMRIENIKGWNLGPGKDDAFEINDRDAKESLRDGLSHLVFRVSDGKIVVTNSSGYIPDYSTVATHRIINQKKIELSFLLKYEMQGWGEFSHFVGTVDGEIIEGNHHWEYCRAFSLTDPPNYIFSGRRSKGDIQTSILWSY